MLPQPNQVARCRFDQLVDERLEWVIPVREIRDVDIVQLTDLGRDFELDVVRAEVQARPFIFSLPRGPIERPEREQSLREVARDRQLDVTHARAERMGRRHKDKAVGQLDSAADFRHPIRRGRDAGPVDPRVPTSGGDRLAQPPYELGVATGIREKEIRFVIGRCHAGWPAGEKSQYGARSNSQQILIVGSR